MNNNRHYFARNLEIQFIVWLQNKQNYSITTIIISFCNPNQANLSNPGLSHWYRRIELEHFLMPITLHSKQRRLTTWVSILGAKPTHNLILLTKRSPFWFTRDLLSFELDYQFLKRLISNRFLRMIASRTIVPRESSQESYLKKAILA